MFADIILAISQICNFVDSVFQALLPPHNKSYVCLFMWRERPCGSGGIRTRGTFVHSFSRRAPSASRSRFQYIQRYDVYSEESRAFRIASLRGTENPFPIPAGRFVSV